MSVWHVTHLTNKCDIMQENWRFQECAISMKPKPKPKDIIPFEAWESGVKLNTGPRMFYNWAGSYLLFQHLVKRNRRTRVQKQSTHKWESSLLNMHHNCSCRVDVRVCLCGSGEDTWSVFSLQIGEQCECFFLLLFLKIMYLWWRLRTLYLLACQMRVTVGDSGLCCCVCVASFER